MEEAMDSSQPGVTQIQEILLAMQKNLECPICLEIMKAPVSAHCAHVFCRFCILKLLEQNKGATKCPLCNGNISKKTLQEDVRFKLVIKGVMEAIGALERDTGFSSAGDHQKMVETASATALQEKQTTVESKGYRGRRNGEEKAEKRNSALQCRNSHSPAPNRTATRCSLRKKSNSSKTVCFEIGSDSSEDHFQKIGTVRRVGLRSGSWSPNGERHSQKPSHSPRHAQFQEPNGEDVVLLGTPDVLDLSEAALGRPEGLRASTRSGGALKEDEAMEERQDLSLPVPCLGRHRVSSSTQEGGPCSLPSVERSHLANEAADPSPNKQVGNKVEMVDMLQPAGSAQVCDLVREDEEELPPAFPRSPLSPLSGAALIQSIQKVNEWFSKSKILSPAPLQEVNAGEGDSDLKPHLSGVDTHLFRKTELREDQWEGAAGWRAGRPCPKLVASRMVDKIFGRRYVRTRKSNPICSERETIHIPSKENFTAVNTQSSDAPVRKIPAQNKPTPDLTSEYVTKEQTATEDSEGAGGHASAVLEEDGPGHAAVGGTPEGAQRPAEHPEKKGASGCEVDASPVRCHSCNMQNLKKARPSLRRRSRQPGRPAGALQLAVQESSGPPEKAEAQDDGLPSSEEPQENGTGQTPVRRSKRLLSRAEEEHGGSEPAKKRRKQLHEAEKEQGKAQVGSGAPLIAEGGPGVLRVGLAAGARKVCGASPDGKSFLSAGCPTERDRPCPVVPGAVSPGSHLAKEEQNHPKAEGLAAVPQAEQSAACAPERHRVCPRDVRGSCRSPRAGHEATGGGELNLGTDDSELDAAFVGKIFRLCKRQSFSLCSPPAKRPATEPQTERRVDGVEGSRAAACVKKSAPGPAGVSEDRREAIPSGVAGGTARLSPVLHPSHSCDPGELSECLQVTLQAPFPDSSCKPAKEAENGDPLQSQQPASDKGESPGMEKTSGDCSSDLWRTGNFQGTGLPPADETSSHAGPSLETRPESDRNKTLACSFCSEPIQPLPVARQLWPPGSGSVGSAGGVKGTGEQIAPMLSTGAFEGPLDRSPEEEIPGFSVLSDTPEGLLGPATDIKGRSLNPPEVGLQATLVVFTRTDQGGPLKEEALECSSSSSTSSSGSGPGGLARGCQRRVPKLSSSSEDEELQCFQALVSGQATSSPSQPAKEAEASAGILAQQSSSQSSPQSQPEGGYLSEESEGSMDLFSSHSRGFEDFASKLCSTRPFTPASTNQRKAMTPRTATEPLGEICRDAEQLLDGRQGCINAEPSLGEALGCDSEVSYLGDSSGFSSKSEILTTQQKDALQNNLERLQQEIAVIEAALKEGGRGASEEVWPLPGEGSVLAAGRVGPARGSTSKLSRGSQQRLLVASPPAGSTLGTPCKYLTPQEHVSCCLAVEPERGSSVAIQDMSCAPERGSQGSPVAPFAAPTSCRGGKGDSKSLLLTSKRGMSLVASHLIPKELRLVQKFARKTKSSWSDAVSEDTTHVIMKTDEDLVCERTLKYFLGIAAQKWVVSYHWVLQSLKEGRVLNEEDFEVRGDISNGRNHQGPQRARKSATGKLFQGLEICCYGPFTDMQKDQLEQMVELCGASLVKEPHLFSRSTGSGEAVLVIQPDAWTEGSACQGIPPPCKATVVAREWVLDSVACYQRMAFEEYIVWQA